MAEDLKASLTITGDSKQAQASIEELNKTLKDAQKDSQGTSEALNELDKSSKDSADSVEELIVELEELGDKKTAIDQLSESLADFERTSKQLGRDFTKLVTAPIAALAGISLKNLYDTGAIEGSVGPARQFALAIQDLMRNFKDLSLEIGETLAPLMINLSNGLSNIIQWFRSLDESTKSFILNIGLVAAAIGPVLLAFSSIAGIFAKLLPLFAAVGKEIALIAGVITPLQIAIVALVAGIASLSNVFFKLRESGLSTGQALSKTFNLFVTGFNNYVVANVLRGVNFLINGLEKLTSAFKIPNSALSSASQSVDAMIQQMNQRFDATKGQIDDQLKTIGSSAGSAFTFGLSDSLSKFFSSDSMSGQLNSELGKTQDKIYKDIEASKREHDLSLEQAEFEHQQKMKDMEFGREAGEGLEERLSAERSFLEKRHKLQADALLRQVEEERKAADAIQDEQERRLAQKQANENAALEVSKLTQQQELELVKQTNAEIEQVTAARYKKIEPYVNNFASGLSGAFADIADSTKSLGEAFADFAKNFINQTIQMITQALILKTIQGSLGIIGFSQGGLVPGFATGGHVRGPGSGTSDSIIARLSNGEFVSDAKTVQHFGVDFFENLKRMARGGVPISPKGSIPGFADGGIVQNASQAPQVVIENRGTPSEVVDTKYDPKSAVLTVILDDLSKNGPASKAIQSTFGVKRGGFR